MRPQLLLSFGFLSMTMLACTAETGDETSTADDLRAEALPTRVRSSEGESLGSVRLNASWTVRRRAIGAKFVSFDVEGTPGDEIEIRATNGTYRTDDVAVMVLGEVDAKKVADCEWYRTRYPTGYASCVGALELPVLAANDDAGAGSKDALLRYRMTGATARVAIYGTYSSKVTVSSITTAALPESCALVSGPPPVSTAGPALRITDGYKRVLRSRECRSTYPASCGPWREESRESGNTMTLSSWGSATNVILSLSQSGGTYATFKDGTRTVSECTAETRCTVTNGKIACEPLMKGQVVMSLGHTALDSDRCDQTKVYGFDYQSLTLTGALGNHCVGLSSPVKRIPTPGGYRELQFVVLQRW